MSEDPPAKVPAKITGTTKARMVAESRSQLKDADEAKDWLSAKGLIPEGEELTINMLPAALLWLASGKIVGYQDLIDGARAVGLCLEILWELVLVDKEGRERQAKKQVEEMMETAQKKMEEVVDASVTTIRELVEVARTDSEGRKQEEEDRTKKIIETIHTQQETLTQTYADTLKKTLPTTIPPMRQQGSAEQPTLDPNVLAREDRLHRQFMIDGIMGMDSATANLAPAMVVEKANLAMQRIEEDNSYWAGKDTPPRPTDAAFVSAMKLNNGGTVLEINSRMAAEWLRFPNNSALFESNFRGSVTLKSRSFTMVAEYLPIRLRDKLEKTEREVEKANGLPEGTIVALRWMRKPESWDDEQNKAHAIVITRDHSLANKTIKEGLVLDGERKQVRKLEDDPKRCFKCQIMEPGHSTKTCKSMLDICAKCAGKHPTQTCKVNRSQY